MRAGEQVTPTLTLVRPVGYGAMGSVWVAEHLGLGTQVAVKLMMTEHARDPELVARFQQEARTMAQVKSPHVVQVLDHGVSADGTPYMVMELLDGETLGSRIRQIGPLSLGDVVKVVAQTASALGRAHQFGVVHRDIKPDNLFLIDVGGEIFVKLLDFGIAKQPLSERQAMTATGRMMGTPLYMSPEQLVSAKNVDFRTDLWALAVVAYQALTGRLPFAGESVGAQALAVHAGSFQPPSAWRSGLPEAVDVWMARALQQDPVARFGSARDMADALERAARGATAEAAAPPDPLPEPAAAPTSAPAKDERAATLVSAGEGTPARVAAELRIGMGRVRLVQGDIVRAGTEAIVSATNEALEPGGGVDAAIHRAAGPALLSMTSRYGRCPTGSAVLTGAGRIPTPTRFVIHAVGPDYDAAHEGACAALLRSAYLESLRLADENTIRSVAFPAISTGNSGYPVAKAARVALGAVMDHLEGETSVVLVVFVLHAEEYLKAFNEALAAARAREGEAP